MSKQDKQKAQQLGKKYQTPCHGIGDCEFEAYQSALEMAEWKDEQYNEERKNFLEKAERYLKNTLYDRVEIKVFGTLIPSIVSKKEFIDNFKKALDE